MYRRITHLDSIRAHAILLVLGLHFFVRWTFPRSETNLYPYGDLFADNILLSNGHLGVEIFFCRIGFRHCTDVAPLHNPL